MVPLINTKEDWWNVLDTHYKNICITITNIYEPFLPSFCKAYQEKDEELILKILNEVWWKAPDDQSIHSLPSWDAICDLCSESWMFN